MNKEYNRRDFLKLGGVIGAGFVSDRTFPSGLAKEVNNSRKADKILKAKERFGFDDNMVIIDDHTHTWPSPEELWAKNIDEHAKYIQRMFIVMRKSARRVNDDLLVEDAWKTLFDEKLPGEYKDVNFRFEKGRYTWQANGEAYYIPVEYSAAPPEMIISLMDEVGIDKAVLQHTAYTYKLNRYYSSAVNKYPERFIGLARFDVSKVYAQEVIEELQTAIEVLGLKGLWYDRRLFGPPPQGWYGYDDFHTSNYDPLWKAVQALNIPVYFQCSVDDYPILELKKWLERHSDITRVLIHGFPQNVLLKDENKIEFSDICVDIVKNFDVYVELLPLCHRNYKEGTKSDRIIRCLYETFGPSKLVWGSELGWTQTASEYSRILGYLKEKCDYMSKDDLKLILEGNLRKIFRI
jgi:predicted TIM-barrel fold metal-dependent hydrolase